MIVTCGSDDKCDAARELGADHAINYRAQDFVEEVKALTGGKGVDVVLDMVGGDYIPRNLACLAEDGRHVTIAVQRGAKAESTWRRDAPPADADRLDAPRPRSPISRRCSPTRLREAVWPMAACAPAMDQGVRAGRGGRGARAGWRRASMSARSCCGWRSEWARFR